MEQKEWKQFVFESQDYDGNIHVQGEIRGKSNLPFYDDLKLKAVIALLNSVDQEHFKAAKEMDIFDDFINEIEETLNLIKKHNTFQGEINNRIQNDYC
ncbi:hypothetical protein [Ectobacillus panaciterrae]|uniref:hypothetical protein n=1 Tax=Ectobacillus panaciterrae TaxID=363872 RepID=UPI000416AD22|nr:hypothetical protein [Ectobacillus panaciterrae]